jgi:hypothetical protein
MNQDSCTETKLCLFLWLLKSLGVHNGEFILDTVHLHAMA